MNWNKIKTSWFLIRSPLRIALLPLSISKFFVLVIPENNKTDTFNFSLFNCFRYAGLPCFSEGALLFRSDSKSRRRKQEWRHVTGQCGRERKQQWIQTAEGRWKDKGTRREGSEVRSWMEEREWESERETIIGLVRNEVHKEASI